MRAQSGSSSAEILARMLAADDSSARLQSALTSGTYPDVDYLDPLLTRCAIEPDFYVRDMLTWALTRLPLERVLPRVVEETRSSVGQARSQALHTLSKLGDSRGWNAITPEHLHDTDTEVARAAWRAAVGLAPQSALPELARELQLEPGRGDLDTKRSLSRAFVELGDAAIRPLESALLSDQERVAPHARATLRLIDDPEATFFLG
jgi:HEAT repeat protein